MKKALRLYKRAARLSDTSAMVRMGEWYETDAKVEERDVSVAVEWYEKAAKQGDEWGMLHLGECHAEGKEG
eukprot:29225-Eustigmatos_ZCMA.PRE.1